MVASISETITNQTRRPPLLSENDHGVISINKSPTPKSRNTCSKYISPSPSHSTYSSNSNSSSVPTPSRRSPSPHVSRHSTTPAVKRSVSADRRRPTTPDRNLKRNNAGKEMSSAAKLLVTSTKRLSASFQGEAFSLATNLNNVKKGTPKTKPTDQQRWPHMTHQSPNTIFSKNLSLVCSVEKSTLIKSRKMITSLHQSIDCGGRSSLDPAIPRSKLVASPKFASTKKFSNDGPLSSSRTITSPSRMRPGSPSVLLTSSRGSSPMRGLKISPIRNSGTFTTESILTFGVDDRRRKLGENRMVDAHVLRLLYNRELQWRFVNARTEDILLKRKRRTEKHIWNTWVTTSDLHDLVTKKRHRLQLLRQNVKLASILNEQMGFLEIWARLEKDYSRLLLGAIKALKSSTLCLPVGDGAIADLQSMRDAISSAMVLMQEMGSSIRPICLKVDEVNSLVKELADVSTKERTLVRICNDLLSIIMDVKVKDCSLRAHTLQKICG